jgi:hypothetical protein
LAPAARFLEAEREFFETSFSDHFQTSLLRDDALPLDLLPRIGWSGSTLTGAIKQVILLLLLQWLLQWRDDMRQCEGNVQDSQLLWFANERAWGPSPSGSTQEFELDSEPMQRSEAERWIRL